MQSPSETQSILNLVDRKTKWKQCKAISQLYTWYGNTRAEEWKNVTGRRDRGSVIWPLRQVFKSHLANATLQNRKPLPWFNPASISMPSCLTSDGGFRFADLESDPLSLAATSSLVISDSGWHSTILSNFISSFMLSPTASNTELVIEEHRWATLE